MDKNMIHIDDFVRGRLSGGEEQERTGSWARMRQMLDEQMPVQHKGGAAGNHWKRTLTIATGIVLLASLTIGGYQSYISSDIRYKKDSEVAASGTQAGSQIVETKGSNSKAGYYPSISETVEAEQVAQQLSAESQSGKVHSTTSSQQTIHQRPKTSVSSIATASTQQQGNNISHIALQKPVLLASATNTPLAEKKSLPVVNPPIEQKQPSIQPEPIQKAIVPQSNESGNTTQVQPTFLKDSVKMLTIHRRYVKNPITGKGTLMMDTVSIQQIAINIPVAEPYTEESLPVTQPDIAIAKNPTDNTTGHAQTDEGEQQTLIPLSSLKVKTQKTKAWNTRSFNDVMRDVKFSISKMRFYPGVIFGINNPMFATNNPFGIHIGVNGTITFGDNWSMVAEFRYVQRINNGNIMQDNYSAITGSSQNPITGATEYHKKNYEHFFKFSTMQSIEMPILVKYSIGRFSAFGGPALSYNFKINAEEVNRPFDSITLTNSNISDNPTLSLNDFRSRISLGYMAGVGYHVSPSVQFDLRISQYLWDNIAQSGSGAYRVSKEWYRQPSFQLSVSYRFSQRSRIPRAK